MARDVRILGPDGEPIRKDDLTRQIATATIDGVRNAWSGLVSDGMTPDVLTELLRSTADGDDIERILSLAEEMEERDLHYLGVIGDRKRALSGIDISVEAASEDAADVALADEVRAVIAQPAFEPVTEDLQDALGKSFSVSEIIWDTSEGQWQPIGYEHRDPRWFRFDRETRRELRLRDVIDPTNGIALAPFKFIQHRPRIKSGVPVRNCYARIVAFGWLCKLFALRDWLAFAEVFGMPLRLGRYGPNASPGDVSTLRRAVANIGSDAAAVLPESMRIEFQQAANVSGGAQLFEGLCVYLDKQVSKAVLGQTMTVDDGSSLSQAQIHNEVRLDILKADAKGLGGTINRDLVKPFVDLNHGPQKAYPRIKYEVLEPEDTKGLTEALEKLVPLGLQVEQSVIRDKLGLPEPGKDAVLLGVPKADAGKSDPALNAQLRRALNIVNFRQTATRDEIDAIVDAGLSDWEEQIQPIVSPIEALVNESESFDEFLRRLPELAGKVDSTELQMALATRTFEARALGDVLDLPV